MSEGFKRVKGFADIYGPQALLFQRMEQTARAIFSRYAFEELRTPIVESTSLFQRSIGQQTDVVQKEMFVIPDRKGRLLSLRPEATAGVLRACAEERLDRSGRLVRVFTIGPMFRYEQPQKGRMRQFHQINCEFLGTDSPFADAELITMLMGFLGKLDIGEIKLKINSLGCRACRPAYVEKLKSWLAGKEENLCGDCQNRLEKNPLRLLDCKEEGCKNILKEAPSLLENNCAACREHFDKTLELLNIAAIKWEIDNHLVRGLDYYQRVTFEVVSDGLGAQTAVAGGGRYDGLLAQIGGSDLPGLGFACGMERLALLMREAAMPGLDFYLLVMDEAALPKGFILAQQLRNNGFSGEMNYSSASFKSLMRHAAKSGAKFGLILGSEEIAKNCVTIKNFASGEQIQSAQENLAESLRHLLENLSEN